MSMENNLPHIRFNGFSGVWDKKILGELVQLENGFAFQSKYFKKNPTKVIVLTPGSVNIGGGFQAGKGQYYDVKQDVSPRYVFESGDMFITMTDLTPTAQALGFPAVIPRDNNTYLHNQRLGKLVGFKGSSGFLYNLLCTPKKQKEIVTTSSGTTVKHTSPDKFLNRFCFFPENDEQTQIGNYFQKLDNLINQHQQKHDKLSSIKKAMLEKMFPKQGETIPEIRFKGFSGEWMVIRLGDTVTCFSGGTPLVGVEEYYKGDIPFIRSAEINKTATELAISESGLKNSSAKIVEVGTILYALYGATSGEVGRARLSGAINQAILAIVPKAALCPEFLSHWLRKSKETIVNTYLQGGQGNLSGDIVKNLMLHIPNFEEQSKIGIYFKQLDSLINQHQQQITKLNNIKQACLSKMFV